MKVALVLVILVLAHGFSSAQATKETKPAAAATAPTPKPPDPIFVQWRIYLDNLAQQLRSVPEERRPYSSTEVGLAYLEVDREEAIRHLTIALEEAYKLRALDQKKFFPMLEYVVQTATRSGTDVASAITAKFKKLEDADLDKTGRWPINTDSAVLDSVRNDEPARRAEHAKSIAPRGLKEGTAVMNLISSLSQDDQALADDVYNTYLQKAAVDKTIPVGALIQMGGYPFGYDEIL